MAGLELTINQLVEQSLPAGFSVSVAFINNSVRKWQLLLGYGLGIPEEQTYELEAYSDLALLLFAQLVVYDVLNKASRSSFLSALTTTAIDENIVSNPNGAVKKITTGPTEVEFHSTAQELSNLLKQSDQSGPGGLVMYFMGEACMIGQRLGIKLPFCASLDLKVGMIKAPGTKHRTVEEILMRNGINNDRDVSKATNEY